MVPDRHAWGDEIPEVQVKRWLETGQFDSADDLLVEEIVVGEPEPKATVSVDFDKADTDLVDNLEIGTWLEFHPDRSVPLRARLAAIDAKARIYVFTDRHGYIIAKCSRNGLIADFRRQSVCVCRNSTRVGRTIANAFFELKRVFAYVVFADAGVR